MSIETVLITAAQATKLQERSLLLQRASVRMTEALDLLGLPVDRPINLRTDDGPDADGMMVVAWEVPDAPPAAPPKPPRKPRKRKKD